MAPAGPEPRTDHAPRPILRPGPRLTAAWVLSDAGRRAHGRPGRRSAWPSTGLYPEQPWAVAALRGNDLVTLAPRRARAGAGPRSRADQRPTSASVLVWLGLLFYGTYNYAYYAFGTAFSDVFLLHVAAFSASSGRARAARLEHRRGRGGPRRGRRHAGARRRGVHDPRRGRRCSAPGAPTSVRFAVTGDLPDERHAAARRSTSSTPSTWGCSRRRSSSPACCCGAVRRGVPCWPWRSTSSGAAYLAVLWAVGGFQADAGIARHVVAVPGRHRVDPRVPRSRPSRCSCTRTRSGPRAPRYTRPARV